MADYKQFHNVEYLDKPIEEKDWRSLRELLCVACKLDPAFHTSMLDDGIEYVIEVKKVPESDLWQAFDNKAGTVFCSRVEAKDPSLCSTDYSDAEFYLFTNFCRERIEDVKKLGLYLEDQEKAATPKTVKTAERTTVEPSKAPSDSNPTWHPSETRHRTGLWIALGVAAVAVVATVIILSNPQ